MLSIIGGTNDNSGVVGMASAVTRYVVFDDSTGPITNAHPSGIAPDGGDPIYEAFDLILNQVSQGTIAPGSIVSVSEAYTISFPADPNNGVSALTAQFPVTYEQTTYQEIETLVQNNILVVLAAGNSGVNIDSYDPPSIHLLKQVASLG